MAGVYTPSVVSPPAEIELGETQVRSLLRAQHADLAHLRLTELDAGWDNVLWRLGDDLLVRLPRREVAVALTLNEQRWLPQLAPSLPLPVSVPIRRGEPSHDYPWPWSILRWIEGSPGDRSELADPHETAERLARFLAALHRPAPLEAPHNPVRGVPLTDRADSFETWISRLSTAIDAPRTREIWDHACSATAWTQAPRWLHGDLHPANVVIADGVLAGVVDFGDICAGDPATDLAAKYLLLPSEAHGTFAAFYGPISEDLEARTLGWAVYLGLVLLGIGLDEPPSGKPTYTTVGRSALQRARLRFEELTS